VAALGVLWLALAATHDTAVQPWAGQPVGQPSAQPGLRSQTDLASLPSAALGAVSQAVGSRDPGFRVRVSGAGYIAINRPQRLRERFDASGVTLGTGALRVSLGRPELAGDARARADHVAPKASSNLVT
jgi:hypothetical protein